MFKWADEVENVKNMEQKKPTNAPLTELNEAAISFLRAAGIKIYANCELFRG
jgi:hypothetical protein